MMIFHMNIKIYHTEPSLKSDNLCSYRFEPETTSSVNLPCTPTAAPGPDRSLFG